MPAKQFMLGRDGNHNQNFSTTRWTLVEALRGDDNGRREKALDELIRCYWPAVYGFLVRRGVRGEQAAELTQGFFAHVLDNGLFERGNPETGRLRNLILRSLRNFEIDQFRRPANRPMVSLDADDLARERAFLASSYTDDPDATFDRRWAVAAMEAAMQRCEAHFRDQGLDRNWLAFEAQTVIPARSGAKPPSLSELSDQLGFAGPDRVANATQGVRRRLRVHLQEVVGETVSEPAEREAEFEFLAGILG